MKSNTLPLSITSQSLKELAITYGTSKYVMKKWLRPFIKDIGKRNGHRYNIAQIEIIYEKLGPPELSIVNTNTFTEIARSYGVSTFVLKRWMAPFIREIGEKNSNQLTLAQIEIIYEKLGRPGMNYVPLFNVALASLAIL